MNVKAKKYFNDHLHLKHVQLNFQSVAFWIRIVHHSAFSYSNEQIEQLNVTKLYFVKNLKNLRL